MKTKLFLSSLLTLCIGSFASSSQTFDKVWMDYGNSEFYGSIINIASQDASGSTLFYDYTSDSPAVPLPTGAANQTAFKYVKASTVATSGFPSFTVQLNGNLDDTAVTATIDINVKVTLYIVADPDGSTGVDLSAMTNNGSDMKFTLQLKDSDGVASTRTSARPLGATIDFNTGWQELDFKVQIRTQDATNLNQYDQATLLLGNTALDGVSGLKFYTDGTNFLDEDVSIYVSSIVSDTALDANGVVLSTNNDINKAESLLFYPNPVEDKIFLSDNVESVKIFNTIGSLVKESNVKQIDISSFSKGVYLIDMESENGQKTVKRFVKK
ncbi:T9SS type A sorting domain-containing protein [Algibacter sp. L1A34]|uniref:T9SS type A sorting domain-containing protein n=1 Tax=Algibacter sp. L1A34 TaxID=2686365 RepID=UPI00131C36B0|nr:T9SS type A sorting domain-containing protein [Algibacter sp. L1A34]